MTEEQKHLATLERRLRIMVTRFVESFTIYFDECQFNFLHGNCYWYARILQERFCPWFPTVLMYNQIDNHFCCRLDTAAGPVYADASGVLQPSHEELAHWEEWNEYIAREPLDAARVYRDCVWHLTEEEWDSLQPQYREEPWNISKNKKS